MNKEIRNTTQLTSLSESRNVEGYAIVFNSDSRNLGGFIETIDPQAVDGILEKSDVLALLNHNEDRGVLARSKYGNGSLKLEVDDLGLRYSFEAPHTALGDELIEGLKRGDISTSSFAFTVAEDKWTKMDDGMYRRHILKFGELFDVSPVYKEAYPDTSVALRKMEELTDEEKRAAEEKVAEEHRLEEERQAEEQRQIAEKTAQDIAEIRGRFTLSEGMSRLQMQDNLGLIEQALETEERADVKAVYNEMMEGYNSALSKSEEDNNKTKTKSIRMKKFNLINAINDVVNNRSMSEEAQAVISAGAAEMRKSGLNFAGQIQLPVEERAAIQAQVENLGQEIVAEDKLNIMEPLRNRMVLGQLGATYLTGLVGDISIPKYSGSNVGWKGEIAPATDGVGEFDEVNYSPKRLTAFVDVSKQFLNQDSVGAEEMLKKDIINAIAEKLEATILGQEAGDATKPAGIFYGAEAGTADFEGVVALETALEEANVYGDLKYVMAPFIKGTLKTTLKADGCNGFVFDNGEVNGYEAMSTNSAQGLALAKWDDLVICQWGAIDLLVDPYTQAANGCIRLVINAYFDAKFRREESLMAVTI